MLAAIRVPIANRDAGKVRRAALTFQGALGNFGDSPAGSTAQALETMGHDNHLAEASAAYQQLVEQMARLQPALAAWAKA